VVQNCQILIHDGERRHFEFFHKMQQLSRRLRYSYEVARVVDIAGLDNDGRLAECGVFGLL